MEGEQALFLEERKASQKPGSAPATGFDRKRKFGQSSSAPPPAVRQPVSAAPTAPQKSVLPTCAQCGRQHGGSVCWKTSGRCFNYGGVGHLSRDCPRRQAQAVVGQGGRP